MSRSPTSGVVFSWALIVTLGASLAGASGTEALPASDWLVATIDATREVGYNVSVAVDPETGHTYISYYEGINGDLWLARTGAPVGNCGPDDTWECQVLDSAGVVGKYSSIAVGGDGPVASLYISYHDVTTGSLKVVEGTVTRATGAMAFAHFPVDPGIPSSGIVAGTKTSITLDETGTPHIAYQSIGPVVQGVRYATHVGGGGGTCGPGNDWECSTAAAGFDVGEFLDIDLSPGGVPNIAFFGGEDPLTQPVIATRVASGGNCNNHTGEWQCEAILHQGNDTGEYLSFAISDFGVPHLAYRNATTESLEWARYVGSGGNCGAGGDSWQCEEIDDVGPGGLPSGIAMLHDSNGYPIIAYQDLYSGIASLEIARPLVAVPGATGPSFCGPSLTWVCDVLDAGDLANFEAYGGLDMAVTAHGDAVVAYRELHDPGSGPWEGRLKVAIEPWLVFRDGFESGGTAAWTTTEP